MKAKKKVHLVLGSGGARGITHIGVIEELERNGFEIISVVGCSMGAIVGGLYCAGFLNIYKKWLLTLTRSKVFNLFDFTFTNNGFLKGEKIISKLQELTGDQNIEKFAIKFTAVATDVLHKKEVHFCNGNLYKALRASMGIPGVFTPMYEDDTFLVDGGVLNPLPLNLVKKCHPDEWIIAVNLNGNNPIILPEDNESVFKNWPWLKDLNLSIVNINKTKEVKKIPYFTIIDLISTSYDFTQDRLVELMIQLYPPNILVEIPRNACKVFDFHKAAELITMGKNLTEKALEGNIRLLKE
ncbi:patatin-like phospholipase family protein [Negadavirga shengliensis]|uniref:Patatin-like phospholipase family protein n=1 Tax=Negadavirga shengliensis TaxID=1389218 RepID=A0ABV9SV78_9BACT